MSITEINFTDLNKQKFKEGLVIQGCGGDLNEWIGGINDILKEEGILLNDTKFEDIYKFKFENLTCLIFPFDDKVQLDIGKFALWRIASFEVFGGTWLSDYIENNNEEFENVKNSHKPDCPLIGANGNIFNLLGIATRTLRDNGMPDEAVEMRTRVTDCNSYEEALEVIGEYVNITFADEMMDEGMGGI